MMISAAKDLSGLAGHLAYEGLLSFEDAAEAQHKSASLNIPFISYVVKNKILSSNSIMQNCIATFGLPFFDLNNYDYRSNSSLLSPELIYRYRVIPLKKQNNLLHIGTSDPTDRHGLDAITFLTGLNVSLYLVDEEQLNHLINHHFKTAAQSKRLESSLNKLTLEENNNFIHENIATYDEPLVQFVDHIIQHALQQKASDIHIEPYETICRIRYRQDGILYEVAEIPIIFATRLVTRLKVMAKLDISEQRLPQDGRFKINNIDIRINTCPILFGEKIVLRLLDAKNASLDINELGLTENQKNLFFEKITRPQGLILVTGPTGSGKTLTLYSALNYLNNSEKNISTVEDPIEIQLHGINQVNINPKINLHFTTALRTFLRQDPDIIMIGEIRDTETAEIAIQAAQTGHLVLSTLHTNSAIEAITRFQSMGVAAYNIINSITLIIAQRLVRKLCSRCKQKENLSRSTLKNLAITEDNTIYHAVGCQYCLQGYYGRTGIYEFLPVTPSIAELIISQASTQSIIDAANKEGFCSLRETGLTKVLQGITSLTEINRVISR